MQRRPSSPPLVCFGIKDAVAVGRGSIKGLSLVSGPCGVPRSVCPPPQSVGEGFSAPLVAAFQCSASTESGFLTAASANEEPLIKRKPSGMRFAMGQKPQPGLGALWGGRKGWGEVN